MALEQVVDMTGIVREVVSEAAVMKDLLENFARGRCDPDLVLDPS